MPKNNQIKVDLDLLADSAAKLEQFNADFKNNVSRLADIMSTGAGGSPQQSGQLSSSASTSAATDRMFQNAPAWAQARGTVLNTPGGGGPSLPPNDISSGGNQGGSGGAFEQDYIEATKRIGEGIPTNFRQALGYYAAGQLQLNPFKDPTTGAGILSGQFWAPQGDETRGRAIARQANNVLFNVQSAKALMMRGMGKYSNFFGGAQALTDAGTSTNSFASRSGIIPGTSLFSGAMLHGLNESMWQPLVSSTFGLNPVYGLGEAQAARQAINSYGWSSGNMGDFLANTLKQNTIRTGLDPQTQMAILDPTLRWGGNSFQQVNTALLSLASAATAAGYNTKEFAQQAASAASQVAQQTGIPVGSALLGISAISSTTGLAPNQVAGLYNTNNMLMAAGITGKSLGQVEFGSGQAGLLSFPLKNLQAMLGMPIQQFEKWFNGNGTPAQKKIAEDKMAYVNMVYQQNPAAFGNIAPLQLAHILSQAGSYKGYMHETSAQAALQNINSKTVGNFDSKIEHILADYFPGNKSRDRKMVEDYIKGRNSKNNTPSEARALALSLVRAYAPKDRRTTSKQMLGLTPQAQKLVQLMGNDPSHTNSGGITGRLSSAASSLGDLASGNPVGAAESAWNAVNPF